MTNRTTVQDFTAEGAEFAEKNSCSYFSAVSACSAVIRPAAYAVGADSRNKRNHGMTLVEVLMAIVIVLVVIPSIGAMYFYAGSQSDKYVREAEAARLAEAIRAYAVEECVDPVTGRVTDTTPPSHIRNSDVPQTTLYGQPAMLPAALGRFQARLVWELRIEKGAEDRGVVQHICTATIANDIDRDGAARNVLSAGDDILLVCKWHLYDTAP